MVDCLSGLQILVVPGQLLKSFPEVVHFQLQKFYIRCFIYVFIDSRQLLHSDSVDFGGQNFIDLCVEVLELFAELLVGGFIGLY